MTQGLVLTATGKINVQECKSAKEISFEIIEIIKIWQGVLGVL